MLIILQAIVIVFVLILSLTAWWYLSIPSNLPPGPIGLPIFGSMFDTWNTGTLPNKLLEWAKIYGPVYTLYVADRLVVVLGNFDAIQEALVKQNEAYIGKPYDHDFISPSAQKALGFRVPPDENTWKENRHFLLRTLHELGVGRSMLLEPRIKREVADLADEIDGYHGRPFDPTVIIDRRAAILTGKLLFGEEFDCDRSDYLAVSKMAHSIIRDNLSMLSPFLVSRRAVFLTEILAPLRKKYENDLITVIRFLKKEIALQKLEFDANDFSDYQPPNYVQAYFKAQQNNNGSSSFFADDNRLVVSVFNLFLASTVSNTSHWALLYFARRPELQEKIYQEIRAQLGPSTAPSYADRTKLPVTEATMMEILRVMDSAPIGNPRMTVAPTKLFGYDIPANTAVIPLLRTVLKDPKVFPNPEDFDYTRFIKTETNRDEYKKRLAHYLPFQTGKRICSGELMVKTETFLFLTGLITRHQFSPCSPEEPKLIQGTYGLAPAPFMLCAKARKN